MEHTEYRLAWLVNGKTLRVGKACSDQFVAILWGKDDMRRCRGTVSSSWVEGREPGTRTYRKVEVGA